MCNRTINPAQNTWFHHSNLPVQFILFITLAFIWKLPVTLVLKHLRMLDPSRQISNQTVVDWFSLCREVAEVVVSHSTAQTSGPGCTVELDETFLTKRKYNRGHITKNMTQVVFVMFCRQIKEGLYFLVPGKSKHIFWSFVKKYIHPQTKIVCTDKAPQYRGIEKVIYRRTKHKTVCHKNRIDHQNHINNLEIQNRW
jgi:hypothetical protein